jgi:hypothetical protein
MLTENPILWLLSNKAQLANDIETAQGSVIFDKMVNDTGSGDGVHFEIEAGKSASV